MYSLVGIPDSRTDCESTNYGKFMRENMMSSNVPAPAAMGCLVHSDLGESAGRGEGMVTG